MKAVYIREFGDIDGLAIREVADPPAPVGRQVLVRVKAAGLNRADLLQLRGHYPPPSGYSPNIPGLEFAGEVVDIGPDVTKWRAGDRVFSIAAGEAQAELLLTDESLLARVPDSLGWSEAGGVPEAFITAHDAVVTQGRLSSGEALLVHAVGSGVGLAALQIAKAGGSMVIGTSRTQDKLDRCRTLGLDVGIATGPEPTFAQQVIELTGGKGANVILDLVGAAYLSENLACAASKARLMLVGLTSGSSAPLDMGVALRKRLTIIGTMLRGRSVEEKAAAVAGFAAEVVPLFADGKVGPNLDRVFPASEAPDAYRYLQSNESFGKVVLEF